jgi:hypothetical protein
MCIAKASFNRAGPAVISSSLAIQPQSREEFIANCERNADLDAIG